MALPRRLIQGYQSFKAGRLESVRERFKILSTVGQRPDTMVIGCCDSRAAPEIIFDASPGELFVVRNVANLVPPFEADGNFHGTSAAIEFAVTKLRLRHLVVLGHGKCGGVAAHIDGAGKRSDFLGQWLKILDPAAEALRSSRTITEDEHICSNTCKHRVGTFVFEVPVAKDRNGLLVEITAAIASAGGNIVSAEISPNANRLIVSFGEGSDSTWQRVQDARESLTHIHDIGSVTVLVPELEDSSDRSRALELKGIENSLQNLRSFPYVRDLEKIGELSLHGAWFDISSGHLLALDPLNSRWEEQL